MWLLRWPRGLSPTPFLSTTRGLQKKCMDQRVDPTRLGYRSLWAWWRQSRSHPVVTTRVSKLWPLSLPGERNSLSSDYGEQVPDPAIRRSMESRCFHYLWSKCLCQYTITILILFYLLYRSGCEGCPQCSWQVHHQEAAYVQGRRQGGQVCEHTVVQPDLATAIDVLIVNISTAVRPFQ